ncbi:MAG TPA: nitrous oxide reductase accessory protein NosL [Geobacteraceae bacterium]
MKRIVMFAVLSLLLTSAAIGADQVEGPKSCQQCGMDRVVFARSRMIVTYADGTEFATCSIHCAAEEMNEHKGKQVKSLQVADYASRKLVDAKAATWVVGGKKHGVMTSLAKWAFARKEDAEKFVQENGGRVTTFDEAMSLALKEDE